MFLIYDLIFIFFSILYLPVFLFKGKAHKGFCQRLAFFPKGLKDNLRSRDNLWLHAVSVGEVQAASSLLGYLRENFPSKRIIISTVTHTGNKLARSLVKADELVIYFPLDLSFIVNKFVQVISPKIFITAETEIWPNLFLSLKRKDIPVILVNGRISERSFKGYKFVMPLIKGVLRSIRLFCMQTEIDAERIKAIGALEESVVVTGNLKFDAASAEIRYQLTDLGFKNGDLLLVAGSTHNGEEEIIIKVYKKLLAEFNNLKLLIAARHIERCSSVENILDKHGLRSVRFSRILKTKESAPVIILDTIGDLNSLYALADAVFMGGSLVKKGGHNIIEPAMYGKPIVFGPFMFNFKDVVRIFLSRSAAIQIGDKKELEGVLRNIFSDNNFKRELGNLAKRIVAENKGAAQKTSNLIRQNLS